MDWNDEELAAAVDAYQAMARMEVARKPYNKKKIYRELAAQFGRSPGAFDYRMQNISAVLKELNQYWIPGLKPAENVGANMKPRLVALLQKSKRRPRKAVVGAAYKEKLGPMRQWLIEVARVEATVTYGQMMSAFGIDRFSLRHAMDYLGHQADNWGEPILTALIVGTTSQRCSTGFAKEFEIEDDAAERARLYAYWTQADVPRFVEPTTGIESLEAKAAQFVSAQARPEQAAFRYRVFIACDGKCVVSGCSIPRALDAAHLQGRDWRLGQNQAQDGILLRKDIHALYDAGELTISDDGDIHFSVAALQHYSQFSLIKISKRL
ncbi:HNH endonuclease signature motif containing protein [Variovorax sp. OK605]|uniref:HNH endonuclease signature motif containing protein n=1 Tax=Variovorax sp. OK605 TaxID=1855317 RepID=UPI0011609840|nr:HNH endonuclease signature motif containing protein [Variovorax sp. OK605]